MRAPYPYPMTKRTPFKYFKTSPEIIRLAVMMYIRLPLSLRNVEDLTLRRRGRIGLKPPINGLAPSVPGLPEGRRRRSA